MCSKQQMHQHHSTGQTWLMEDDFPRGLLDFILQLWFVFVVRTSKLKENIFDTLLDMNIQLHSS